MLGIKGCCEAKFSALEGYLGSLVKKSPLFKDHIPAVTKVANIVLGIGGLFFAPFYFAGGLLGRLVLLEEIGQNPDKQVSRMFDDKPFLKIAAAISLFALNIVGMFFSIIVAPLSIVTGVAIGFIVADNIIRSEIADMKLKRYFL